VGFGEGLGGGVRDAGELARIGHAEGGGEGNDQGGAQGQAVGISEVGVGG
jgi:hypothetical protein